MIFKEKYFSCYILLTDQISLFNCILLYEISDNIFIAIVCVPVCDFMNFKIYQDKKLFKKLSLKRVKSTFLEDDSPNLSQNIPVEKLEHLRLGNP